MVIRDNGIGFDPNRQLPDHFGLGIMEERAESIGARYEIKSNPIHEGGQDIGTCITVTWKNEEG